MIRKHTRLLIQRPDGRFLDQGFDCADRWVIDPQAATPVGHYEFEEDTNEYKDEGCIVVEFEVSLTPTGRTCADLFKEQRAATARREREEEKEKVRVEKALRWQNEENARLIAKTLGIET